MLMIAFASVANAQTIKKVKATDVRMMIDTSTSPLIVNFWATWCAPCVKEIPWFDSIIAAKKSSVQLLLVSLDFPESYPNDLTSFVQKKKYKGEVVFLDESNADYFCPAIEKQWDGAIPATLFIDNKKNHKVFIASQLTPARFAEELDKLGENKDGTSGFTSPRNLVIISLCLLIAIGVIIYKKRAVT